MSESKEFASEKTESTASASGAHDASCEGDAAHLQERSSSRRTGNSQGRRIVFARRITMGLIVAAVLVSLAFDLGWGTPSSFGLGEFFLLCPLGGIEAMLASKSFLPVSFISLAVVLLFSLVFGRAWCSWGCPAPVIRRFFRREPKTEGGFSHDEGGRLASSRCSAAREAGTFIASLRYIGCDSRTWVLAGVLIATAIVGLPLFCLVCPIGLTFGTVGSLWHLFVDKQITLSCVVFPLALVVELVMYRRWCLDVCPVAGLLNIFGQFAKLFRPRVQASTCLRRAKNSACSACLEACPEHIDLHSADAALQLGECTRCGECVRKCPSGSVSIKILPDSSPAAEKMRRQ